MPNNLPSDQDIDAALSGHAGAQAALVGVQNVPPQAAANAAANEDATGIPAEVGMYAPGVVDTHARQAAQTQALAASPSTAQWVANAPPQHVAAVQNDLSALARVGMSVDQYKAQGGPIGDIVTAFRQTLATAEQAKAKMDVDAATKNVGPWWKDYAAGLFNTTTSALNIPFAPLTETFARGLNQVLPPAGGSFTVHKVPGDVIGEMVPEGAKVGQTIVNTPETRAQSAETFGQLATMVLLGVHGGEEGGARPSEESVGPASEEPSGPQPRLSPPSVGVDAQVDAMRAGMAAHDAQQVSAVQEEIANSGLQTKAPDALAHYLEDQAPGIVSVDADKLAELAQQGHEPFPELQDEVRLAALEGRDVEVSTGRYLAATSGQPFAEELNQATTFREDGVAAQDQQPPVPVVEPPKVEGLQFPGLSEVETTRAKTIAEKNLAETTAVFRSQFLAPLFQDAKALGMTEGQMERFAGGLEAIQTTAHERAVDAAERQVKAERGPEFKEAVERHSARLREQMEQISAVRAMQQLSQTGFKLDRDLVQNFFPEPASRLPDSILRNGGNHPSVAADLVGYLDGAHMVSELADLQDEIKATGSKGLKDHLNKVSKALARDAAAEELGYSMDPVEVRARAVDTVPQDAITRFLSDELQELGKQVGFPLNLGQLKADAAAGFARQVVKDALNIAKTERDVYRSGERALRAMGKDDLPRAFRWRQVQFYRRLQLLESFKFQKEFAWGNKTLTRWGRGRYTGDPNFGAVLESLSADMGYGLSRDVGELQRYLSASPVQNAADAVRVAQGSGVPLEDSQIPPMVRAQSLVKGQKVTQNISVSAFRDFMDMANGIAKFGQELGQVELAGERAELDYVANSVQNSADRLVRKFTMNDLAKERNSVFLRTKDTLQSVLVNNLRPETFLHWMDGEKWGPLMESVVSPLQSGKHLERELTNSWAQAIRAVGNNYYKEMRQELEVPAFMRSQVNSGNPSVIRNRGDVRTALLHLGSETARTKLLEGYRWGDVQEQWLLSQATDADKKFLQTFWAENEKLFELADRMYGKVRGYGLEADPPRMVRFADGSELRGGHVHVQYNQPLLDNARIQPEAPASTMDMDGGDLLGLHPASALPSAFYGLKRTGFVGPVQLDFHYLSSGVSETIHDIAFRPALVQAQKVLTDPRVRDGLRTTLGPEYEKQMMPWLRYIAQQRIVMDQSTIGLANMVRTMSNNFTWAEIAYNLGSFLKHSGIGLVHAGLSAKGDVVGWSQALFDTLGPGTKQAAWRDFIHTQMPEVGQLSNDFESSLMDAIDAQALANNPYKAMGYALFGMSKRIEARATALNTYRQEMSRVGDHAEAVKIAQKVVRDSQGVGHPVDSPALGRHTGTVLGEAGRMAYGLLMSFRGASFNYLWRAQQQVELGVRLMGAGRTAEGVEAIKRGVSIGAGLILGSAGVTALYGTVLAGRRERDKRGRPESLGQSAATDFAWGVGDATAGNLMVLAPILEAMHYGDANTPTGTMAKEGGALWKDINASMGHGKPADQHAVLDGLALVGQATGLIPVEAAHFAQATTDQLNPQARLSQADRQPIALAQRALLNRSPQYTRAARRGRR